MTHCELNNNRLLQVYCSIRATHTKEKNTMKEKCVKSAHFSSFHLSTYTYLPTENHWPITY